MVERADSIGSGLCAIVGVALVLGGGLFDAAPLIVAGVAFAALGAATHWWVRAAARGARVERSLSARRIEEEQPLGVRVTALAGRLPFPGGELRDPLLPAGAPLPVGGREARIRIEVRFERRGARSLEAPTLVLRDPLGVTSRSVAARAGDALVVLPRTFPVRVGARAGQRGEGLRALLASLGPGEFDGLRPYQPGTPATRIHWPALARGAGLLERRLRAPAERRPLVVLDPRGPAAPEDLDAAVRAAASICLALARAGGCSLLLPGDRRASAIGPDLRAWPRAHVRLALVEAGPPPALADAARPDALVWVAARTAPRLPFAHARIPRAAVLVVPAELAGRRALFEVAGCTAYELATPARRAA